MVVAYLNWQRKTKSKQNQSTQTWKVKKKKDEKGQKAGWTENGMSIWGESWRDEYNKNILYETLKE